MIDRPPAMIHRLPSSRFLAFFSIANISLIYSKFMIDRSRNDLKWLKSFAMLARKSYNRSLSQNVKINELARMCLYNHTKSN